MARVSLHLDSATADEARAFLLAYQNTDAFGLPKGSGPDPTVHILGAGWHINTPAMSTERAVAMTEMWGDTHVAAPDRPERS